MLHSIVNQMETSIEMPRGIWCRFTFQKFLKAIKVGPGQFSTPFCIGMPCAVSRVVFFLLLLLDSPLRTLPHNILCDT